MNSSFFSFFASIAVFLIATGIYLINHPFSDPPSGSPPGSVTITSPVPAPEIDGASGTSAIVLLVGTLLLVRERSGSRRS
ncbi:MAG: VPEID-CTERM sorting domain-containing protein [Gammaproteobacteria bacterium]